MDCQTATRVYATGTPLTNIQAIFPEAWAFLEQQVQGFVQTRADRFDQAIKTKLGSTPFPYRIVHRDDRDRLTHDLGELLGDITSRLLLEQHFSQIAQQPIHFSTICCSSHLTTGHELSLEEVLPIQIAAIELQQDF
jgi:hypothetical protein